MADNDPDFAKNCNKTLTSLLEEFYMQRNAIIHHLFSLPEDRLYYTGRHSNYGLLTIIDWTEFFLLHEAHHCFNIFKPALQIRAKR